MANFLVRLSEAKPERITPSLVKDHVAWLSDLSRQGKVILCGPCSDGTAILVLKCATQKDAERIAGSDPFAREQAYEKRSIVSFRLASPENNFLLN